jgi:hypothetical protein
MRFVLRNGLTEQGTSSCALGKTPPEVRFSVGWLVGWLAFTPKTVTVMLAETLGRLQHFILLNLKAYVVHYSLTAKPQARISFSLKFSDNKSTPASI